MKASSGRFGSEVSVGVRLLQGEIIFLARAGRNALCLLAPYVKLYFTCVGMFQVSANPGRFWLLRRTGLLQHDDDGLIFLGHGVGHYFR